MLLPVYVKGMILSSLGLNSLKNTTFVSVTLTIDTVMKPALNLSDSTKDKPLKHLKKKLRKKSQRKPKENKLAIKI